MVRRIAMGAILAAAACGGAQSPPATPTAATPQTRAQHGPSPAQDATTIDVCELVPVGEIAAALGGTPGAHPPNGHAYPGAESECWYEVSRGSGRMPEVVGLFLYPPEYFAAAREEGATDIPDLGDGAFHSPQTDIATVIVLRKGVAVIDARAGTSDHAKAVAELALRKLERP